MASTDHYERLHDHAENLKGKKYEFGGGPRESKPKEPAFDHAAAGEAAERTKCAVNMIVLKRGVTHEEAQAIVEREGVQALLDAHDRGELHPDDLDARLIAEQMPSAADLDAVAEEQKAAEATSGDAISE